MTQSPRSLSALGSDRETLGIGNSIHVNADSFCNYTFASFSLASLEVALSTQVDVCFSNCRASAEEIGSKGAQSRQVSCHSTAWKPWSEVAQAEVVWFGLKWKKSLSFLKGTDVRKYQDLRMGMAAMQGCTWCSCPFAVGGSKRTVWKWALLMGVTFRVGALALSL